MPKGVCNRCKNAPNSFAHKEACKKPLVEKEVKQCTPSAPAAQKAKAANIVTSHFVGMQTDEKSLTNNPVGRRIVDIVKQIEAL